MRSVLIMPLIRPFCDTHDGIKGEHKQGKCFPSEARHGIQDWIKERTCRSGDRRSQGGKDAGLRANSCSLSDLRPADGLAGTADAARWRSPELHPPGIAVAGRAAFPSWSRARGWSRDHG